MAGPAGGVTRPGDEAPPGTPGTEEVPCPECQGSGFLVHIPCQNCNGTGVVTGQPDAGLDRM